jgi:hypothetical protein
MENLRVKEVNSVEELFELDVMTKEELRHVFFPKFYNSSKSLHARYSNIIKFSYTLGEFALDSFKFYDENDVLVGVAFTNEHPSGMKEDSTTIMLDFHVLNAKKTMRYGKFILDYIKEYYSGDRLEEVNFINTWTTSDVVTTLLEDNGFKIIDSSTADDGEINYLCEYSYIDKVIDEEPECDNCEKCNCINDKDIIKHFTKLVSFRVIEAKKKNNNTVLIILPVTMLKLSDDEIVRLAKMNSNTYKNISFDRGNKILLLSQI